MAGLLSGRQLKAIFSHFSPFDSKGNLKPEEQRVSLLAANVNMPLEVFGRALVMAAAQGDQSPLIIQLSYNAINLFGGAPGVIHPLEGSRRVGSRSPALDGARMAHAMISSFAEQYGARWIAISLDHFRVPAFRPEALTGRSDSLKRKLAIAKMEAAQEAMRPVFGEKVEIDSEVREAYISYLCSNEYESFKRDFMLIIQAISPAWGMIDTEKLPPLLDFVVTKDITDAVRSELGNEDVGIEAEYGATGTSGQTIAYSPLGGKELEQFAREVASFINYTGADGIAYPIGMEHAAKANEKHEPDVERLKVVQATLLKETGRYIPFAQHGGTGAARVVRGLVGKNNVNTRFLVVAGNTLADHVQEHLTGIRAGEKEAVDNRIFTRMIEAVAREAINKIKETGSYQKGPELIGLTMIGDVAVEGYADGQAINLSEE